MVLGCDKIAMKYHINKLKMLKYLNCVAGNEWCGLWFTAKKSSELFWSLQLSEQKEEQNEAIPESKETKVIIVQKKDKSPKSKT